MTTRDRTRRALFAAALGITTLAACSRTVDDLATGPEAARAAARADFRIEMEREGGIGTLIVRESVEGASGRFVATTHRICSVPQCQAAIDSASGTLDAATIGSLIEAVERARLSSLQDDYGRTVGGADMMTHTLVVRHDGRTKSVRGDDGTFPESARGVERALHDAITKARGR